jgi:hypothetical protein
MKLTPSQRRALRHLRDRPDATINTPSRHGDLTPQVANALNQHDLAVRFCWADGRDQVLAGDQEHPRVTDPGRVTITPAGRGVAHQAEPETAFYLAACAHPAHGPADEHDPTAHGLSPDRDAIGAGPYQDPEQLRHGWTTSARARHLDARPPARVGRQLANLVSRAA